MNIYSVISSNVKYHTKMRKIRKEIRKFQFSLTNFAALDINYLPHRKSAVNLANSV